MGTAKNAFENIRGAWREYGKGVSDILSQYQQTTRRAEAKKADYIPTKGEEYLRNVRSKAREKAMSELDILNASFRGTVTADLDTLTGEVRRKITEVPPASFVDACNIYRKFGLKPSETELRGLLAASHGNHLARRMLQGLTDNYEIETVDLNALESDIAAIKDKLDTSTQYAPLDAVHILYEMIGTGDADKTRFIIHSETMEKAFTTDISEAASKWESGTVASLRERINVDKQDPKEAAEAYAQDIDDYAKNTTVNDGKGADVEMAKKIGQAKSGATLKAADALKKYIG